MPYAPRLDIYTVFASRNFPFGQHRLLKNKNEKRKVKVKPEQGAKKPMEENLKADASGNAQESS